MKLFESIYPPCSGCLKKWCLALVLLKVLTGTAFAQVGTINSVQQPLSPDVLALSKFVEIPVSNYSGLPDISVPLYEFNAGDIRIPISLSYHASGIKVRDIPGWVGSGWALNAGGIITRVVRGYPDDNDFSNPGPYKANIDNMGTPGGQAYPDMRLVQGIESEYYPGESSKVDLEFDLFYFNFMGHTGRFTFDKNGQIMMLNVNNMKASYSNNHFKLTDDNGVEYQFNDVDAISRPGNVPYNSTWYLSKIVIPHKNQSIEFKYVKPSVPLYATGANIFNHFDRVLYQNASPVVPSLPNLNPLCVNGFGGIVQNQLDVGPVNVLQKIGYKGDTVQFYASTATRADVYKLNLDSIRVLQKGIRIHAIKFGYGYSNNGSDPLNKKMQLSTVQIDDQSPYTFGYIGSYMGKTMAAINAPGEDIWGFYNGEDSPFMPATGIRITSKFRVYYSPLIDANSSYKNPDYKYAQIGTLNSITYPTGGRTEFTYEGNDFIISPYGGIAPEDDPGVILVLDSIRTTGAASPDHAPGYNLNSNEVTIHQDQTVTIQTSIGLSNMVNNLTTYQNYVYNNGDGTTGTVRLYKFNTTTGVFDIVESRDFNPVTVIGNPVNNAAFLLARPGGISQESHTRVLTEGRYKIETETQYSPGVKVIINLTNQFKYRKPGPVYNAGGIRIKKIKFISPVNGSGFEKNYDYNFTNLSSGTLEAPFANASAVLHWGETRVGQTNPDYCQGFWLMPQVCSFYYIHHENVIPLGNAQGGIIGYAKVTERNSDGSKKVMNYTSQYYNTLGDGYNATNLGDVIIIDHITVDNSAFRGLLSSLDYYNTSGRHIKTEYHSFNNLFSNPSTTPKTMGMFLAIGNITPPQTGCLAVTTENYGAILYSYSTYQRKILSTGNSTVYFNPTDTVSEGTIYEYGNPAYSNPTRMVRYNSLGDSIITRYKYAYDYTISGTSSIPFSQGIKNMQDKNMIAIPVETTVETKSANGTSRGIKEAQLISFKTDAPLADTVYSLNNSAGLTDFSPASFTVGTASKDSRYQRKQLFSRYDSFNQVAEQAKEGEPRQVLVWGYNHRFIVASVSSSDYATVIALVDTAVINNPSSDAALRTELQKIRTALATGNPKAKVTSYTYATLMGMTSMTDPRGETTFYEYDSYGKLKRRKDADTNIKENLWYHYKP